VAGGLGTMMTGVAAALALGRVMLDHKLSAEVEALFAAGLPADPPAVDLAKLAGLPDPVQRWLRASGAVDRAAPSTVRLRYNGQFRLGEQHSWMPYSSQTYYTTNPPALLWTVDMRMFGIVPLAGRDRYTGGQGDITMRLLWLFPVANKTGNGLNQGGLLRYLGETAWFPAAAIAPYITWEARDPSSAVATMTYGGEAASLTFVFDAEGQLIRQEAAARYNDARGRLERWSVPITAHGVFDGVRVPTEGSVVWNYDTGDFEYMRWRVSGVKYGIPHRY
jgi:hypothetical protein